MTHQWRQYLLAAIVAGLGCSGAMAQSTLGDLLNAGGVKLTKQQVTETLIGGTLGPSEPGPAGRTWQTEYKPDGTYSATFSNPAASSPSGRFGSYFGKWTLGDDGKLCTEGYDTRGKDMADCLFFFRQGDQLYVVQKTDTNRSAPAYKRVVKR